MVSIQPHHLQNMRSVNFHSAGRPQAEQSLHPLATPGFRGAWLRCYSGPRLASTHPHRPARANLHDVPHSDPENKQWALDHIRELDPAVVVDIGPGAGTYSDLARAHTTARWSAIEAWAPYIPAYGLWDRYDHVAVSDIRHADLRTVAPAPDLAIIGDVLEHMPAHEAQVVITRLQAWTEHLLVALPIIHYEQGAVGGNWFETHHHHWTFDEMLDALGPGLVDSIKGETLGYYWWSHTG